MPYKAPKLCGHAGCSQLTHERYCQAHKRGATRRRGYGTEWQRIRRLVLEAEPLCRMCGELATEVDHITPIHRGGTNQASNLQPICKSCHSRKGHGAV